MFGLYLFLFYYYFFLQKFELTKQEMTLVFKVNNNRRIRAKKYACVTIIVMKYMPSFFNIVVAI